MTRTQTLSWTVYLLAVLLLFVAFARAAPLNLPQEPGYVPPSYWSQFPATKGKWDQPSFYPIGVWLQNVTTSQDAETDKAIGINTYVGLTGYSQPSVIRAAGLYAIRQWEVTSQTPAGVLSGYGAETVGWLVGDEHDMQYGPGWSQWDGIYFDNASGYAHCIPKNSNCGYTVAKATKAKFPVNGRFYAANYAKGVLFWQSDTQAQVWLNPGFQDISGADNYWHHDKDACLSTQGGRLARQGFLVATGPPDGTGGGENTLTPEECFRSSNFAAATEKIRAVDGVDGKYQPLWCFVDTGRVTPAQMQGEVAACLISGSYPVYFNHVFEQGPVGTGKGPCITSSALRDSCYAGHRQAATAINSLIKDLALNLNSPRLKWDFGTPKLLTRLSQAPDETVVVLAMQKQGSSGTYALNLPISGMAKVYKNGTETTGQTGNKLTLTFSAESDWYAVKISAAAVPPIPADPLVTVHQSWLDQLKALANNPK